MAPDTTTGREPPQRREARLAAWRKTSGDAKKRRAPPRRNDVKRGLRNGVAPYIPAVFCRDVRSAGHGATGTVAASPGFSRIGP